MPPRRRKRAVLRLGHDELLVDARDGVGVDELQRVGRGREGVAEAGHVDAEQLELGGHVGAGEGAGALAQGVDDDLGHRVARGHQAVHPPARGGALADGEDVRVGGAALLVDEHAAALGEVEAALAGDRVPGPDAGGEHHDLGVDRGRLGALLGAGGAHPQPGHRVVAGDGLGEHAGVDADAELLDVADQGRAARAVELHGHQPRRHLHDVGLQAELDERVGRLEPEQSPADHDAAGGGPAGGPDGLEVLDGAVDEAAVLVAALDRRHERRGARGQHQRVVLEGLDAAGVGERLGDVAGGRRDVGDRAAGAVDLGHLGVEDQGDARVVVRPLGQQRQLVGALRGEEAGEGDAVVRRAALGADHHDVVGLGEAALDGSLDETVADHSVADDDEGGARVPHATTLGSRCCGGCYLMFQGGKPSLTPLTAGSARRRPPGRRTRPARRSASAPRCARRRCPPRRRSRSPSRPAGWGPGGARRGR